MQTNIRLPNRRRQQRQTAQRHRDNLRRGNHTANQGSTQPVVAAADDTFVPLGLTAVRVLARLVGERP
jgi:hypothetical protein